MKHQSKSEKSGDKESKFDLESGDNTNNDNPATEDRADEKDAPNNTSKPKKADEPDTGANRTQAEKHRPASTDDGQPYADNDIVQSPLGPDRGLPNSGALKQGR